MMIRQKVKALQTAGQKDTIKRQINKRGLMMKKYIAPQIEIINTDISYDVLTASHVKNPDDDGWTKGYY